MDYAAQAGFATDPARIRSPKDKPKVERAVQFVRGNFFNGEVFADLDDAQARAIAWCQERAGMRIHGATAARPLEVFETEDAPLLLPAPEDYDVPVFRQAKVHRDHHIEVGKALYSVPGDYIGQSVDIRAGAQLVKIYHRGQLIKTHATTRPGSRSTDPGDLPAEKSAYALRDISRLIRICAVYGPNTGIYAERIMDDPLPWTRMRAVYRLIGLARQYGPDVVEAACSRALDVDVVAVGKIASMLAKATENTAPVLPVPVPARAARFARDPSEYATSAVATARTTMVASDRTTAASERTDLATAGTTAAANGRTTAAAAGTPAATKRTGPIAGRGTQPVLIAGGAGNTREEDR